VNLEGACKETENNELGVGTHPTTFAALTETLIFSHVVVCGKKSQFKKKEKTQKLKKEDTRDSNNSN
jgi:hypothetical protein